jgi:hypothetical protein
MVERVCTEAAIGHIHGTDDGQNGGAGEEAGLNTFGRQTT